MINADDNLLTIVNIFRVVSVRNFQTNELDTYFYFDTCNMVTGSINLKIALNTTRKTSNIIDL